MNRKKLALSLLGLLMITLFACRSKEDESAEVNHTLLYFDFDSATMEEDGYVEDQYGIDFIGSLYLKPEDSEPILIGENILFDPNTYYDNKQNFQYDNETGNVLYIDYEDNLYLYDGGEASQLIDSDVKIMEFSKLSPGYVFYRKNNWDTYVTNGEYTENLGSDITEKEVYQEKIYYIDDDYQLVSLDLETSEKNIIAIDAFELLIDETWGILYYTSGLDEPSYLFAVNLEDNAERLLSDVDVGKLENMHKEGNTVYFTHAYYDDFYSTFLNHLYYIKPDMEEDLSDLFESDYLTPRTAATFREKYEILDDGKAVFFGEDSDYSSGKNLYYGYSEQLISKDVVDFKVENGQVFYWDDSEILYRFDPETEARTLIGEDIDDVKYFEDGRMFYLTREDELYEGNNLLANDITRLATYEDTLAYSNGEFIYLYKDGEGLIQVLARDNLDDYSMTYFQNNLVHYRSRDISDVKGVWHLSLQEASNIFDMYFEILDDRNYTILLVEVDFVNRASMSEFLWRPEEGKFTYTYGRPDSIVLVNEEEVSLILGSNSLTLTKVGDKVSTEGISLTPSSLEEVLNRKAELEAQGKKAVQTFSF